MEKIAVILSRDVTPGILHTALCEFLHGKNLPCFDLKETALTAYQQYNMAADAADARQPLTPTLLNCLIAQAELNVGRNLSRKGNIGEYSTTWVSTAATQLLLQASAYTNRKNMSGSDLLQSCDYVATKGLLGEWISCAINFIVNNRGATQKNRRLLGESSSSSVPIVTQQQGLSLASNSGVSWTLENTRAQVNPSTRSIPPPTTSTSTTSDAFPIWAAAVVGGVGGLIVISLLLYFLYRRRFTAVQQQWQHNKAF
jgi:hypothetical protein